MLCRTLLQKSTTAPEDGVGARNPGLNKTELVSSLQDLSKALIFWGKQRNEPCRKQRIVPHLGTSETNFEVIPHPQMVLSTCKIEKALVKARPSRWETDCSGLDPSSGDKSACGLACHEHKVLRTQLAWKTLTM